MYSSLRHVIDYNEALDKVDNEGKLMLNLQWSFTYIVIIIANNGIQETRKLCKKLDDLKQQDGFPWSNLSDNTRDQGKTLYFFKF